MNTELSYCGQLVREQDPDRFLLSMFTPADCRDPSSPLVTSRQSPSSPLATSRQSPSSPAATTRREALWALFAFNYEIAKTREVVSETQLGLIRLQWWREAIEKIYEGNPPLENEILPALVKAIHEYDLPKEHFDTLIYAREFDLEDVLPGNVEGLLNYADFTHTPLMKLAVQVCGDDPEAEPIQPIASSYTLIGLLRGVVFHARQRRCYLPEDLLKAEGVRLNNLYELKPDEGLKTVIKAVANEVIIDAKPSSKILKKMQKLTKIYLRQLKGADYDVFHPKLATPPAFKALRLVF